MMARAHLRWTLAGIERQLRASEPQLAAMFRMFARLTHGESPAGAEAMSHYHGRRRLPRLWPCLPAALLVALIVVAVAVPGLSGPPCRSTTSARPGAATSSAPVSCPPMPRRAAAPRLGR
jgi:hypothetical protein